MYVVSGYLCDNDRWSSLDGEQFVVNKSTSVIEIRALATSKTSRTKRIGKSSCIKASIVFGFYFCDHDPVARLVLSNKR